jgi:hypothetical protein
MSDLIRQIQTAQRNAGEAAVVEHLMASGLIVPSEAEKLAAARKEAHDALTAAERAWYAYAGLCDVGPDRTRAFDVYENIRNSRRL